MFRKACWMLTFFVCAAWGSSATCVAADGDGKVAVGKKAPDFVMTGIDGREFKLTDKIGKDKNIVLMFSRANW
jgi:hypothetical protein